MTAAAALHFMRSGVDMAVFEVGLGGRLDATRLVDAALTVITGISVDHREHLGRTRAKILGEKLGITREGVPLVASLDSEALLDGARRYCAERGVPMTDAREGVRRRLVSIGPDSMTFNLGTPARDYGRLRTSMIGRAQMKNASTAVRCAELLEGRFAGIGEGTIREGLKKAFMQGRFQVMPGNPRVVLDVSHNEESLLAAMDTLTRISPPEKNVLIFGIMERKETGRFPASAARSARKVILVPLKDEGSATAGRLSEIFASGAAGRKGAPEPGKGKPRRRAGRARGGAFEAETAEAPGMAEAIDLAAGSLGPGDTLLVLGSHVAVEEAAGCLDGPAARKGSR
jgi:dihydrofolate synthase/folylpolyglutamate synthase